MSLLRHTGNWGLRDYGVAGQLGLEKSPEEYVEKLIDGFREVWRVLRDDGTLWVNLGDSYTSGGRKTRDPGQSKIHPALENWDAGRPDDPEGLKPKDLVGIPWRVAFALQSDGWYLRSDIIWHKPNPMPESVTDRPTKSHEYIFLLSKRPKYYYDADAIREESQDTAGISKIEENGAKRYREPWSDNKGTDPKKHLASWAAKYGSTTHPEGRNKRTVWTVATAPYREAHFATFPPDLIKPCILAGCPVGGTVLDPFAGSGTTGEVALELGRKAVLIELNPKYAGFIRQRTNVTPGLALA